MSRNEEARIAWWIVDTCLMFGSSVETAFQVAGLFIQGVKENTTSTTTPRAPEDQK